ncbi:hypothetical protein LEMLEM_LOCUS8827 [Lemmus lemmus]
MAAVLQQEAEDWQVAECLGLTKRPRIFPNSLQKSVLSKTSFSQPRTWLRGAGCILGSSGTGFAQWLSGSPSCSAQHRCSRSRFLRGCALNHHHSFCSSSEPC